jgi:peptide/nickel transport system permease protein
MADKLGFHDPVHVQYARFAKGIVAGAEYDYGPGVEQCPAPCFGYSFLTQRPVWPELMDRLPVTISLAAGGAVLWLAFGVGVGVVSALRRGSALDRTAMGVALAGVSLPIFFTGLACLALFSYKLGWTAPGGSYTPLTENPARWAYDLLLPWTTLAFLYAAGYARLTRAGMLETMGEDYIRTARAKGLPERTVVVRHGLRSALTPILTIFGLDLGLLLGGAVLTESTFSLPGIGKYAIEGIFANDLPKVLGTVMLGSFFIVIANLVVDILYAVVDPRVRT